MKTIICVGGYARAGKSTTVEILESLDIPVFSASRFLHKAVDLTKGTVFEPWAAAIKLTDIAVDIVPPSERMQCITMAERILVPTFGRKLFAHAMFDGLTAVDNQIVAIETIGGDEWQEFANLAEGHRLVIWNVRSEREQPGIDIRELIPDGQDIWNDETLEDWREYIENRVYFLKGGTN
jgi:hypothetical protein